MIENWRERLQKVVSPLSAGVGALQVNNFRPSDDGQTRPGRTAAVLVPILNIEVPEVLLTRRSLHLAHHPGQVSFPGGAAEDQDVSAVRTALREAEEEVGLNPDNVTPLGFLDRFDSISDYRVLPVVGLVKPPLKWTIDEKEVEEAFTIPLAVVLDIARYKEHPMSDRGQGYVLHSLEWHGHVIWGLTAAVLINLSMRMNGTIK
ncbi:MAG: 8-oxo-dGTP pyrophosphatase MutT (NUDIX family) [Lysobacterales bacterium]|jgi:8-oxo-dGTP pyrophosphatase MutT (NUDIX family)